MRLHFPDARLRLCLFFFSRKVWLFNQFSTTCGSHVLFTDPQISLFSNFFIKNESHGTIYIFQNYFAIVFFSFQFSAVSKQTLNAFFYWLLKIRNWKQFFACFQFPSQIEFWEQFLFFVHFGLPNKFFSLKNRKLFLETENKSKNQLPKIPLETIFRKYDKTSPLQYAFCVCGGKGLNSYIGP